MQYVYITVARLVDLNKAVNSLYLYFYKENVSKIYLF